jgi:hypothetical protein
MYKKEKQIKQNSMSQAALQEKKKDKEGKKEINKKKEGTKKQNSPKQQRMKTLLRQMSYSALVKPTTTHTRTRHLPSTVELLIQQWKPSKATHTQKKGNMHTHNRDI